ncbi:hypothetical protein [Slackia heliotrinireducens]|uniref:hypothetical protein n=1 Tax=Slackia heliotrinireducens TaxID=84110 RepID=UPI00331515D7
MGLFGKRKESGKRKDPTDEQILAHFSEVALDLCENILANVDGSNAGERRLKDQAHDLHKLAEKAVMWQPVAAIMLGVAQDAVECVDRSNPDEILVLIQAHQIVDSFGLN